MNWDRFNTYGDSLQNAFETFCNQLFERYLFRNYKDQIVCFEVINGSGGDGGVEAYGELLNDEIIAVQAKWFKESMGASQLSQIKNSIITAKTIRPNIKKYILCIPHNINSSKIGRNNRSIKSEDDRIKNLEQEIQNKFPDLTLVWWYEKNLLDEVQKEDNEGVQKYWFDKEVITLEHLKEQFELSKRSWLHERYIAELHGRGEIHKQYDKLCSHENYRKERIGLTLSVIKDIKECISLIDSFIEANSSRLYLNKRLFVIKRNLTLFLDEFKRIKGEIERGNPYYKVKPIQEVFVYYTKLQLEKIKPKNIQKNVLPALISSLDNIHSYNLPKYLEGFIPSEKNVKLILGKAGSGKTHGLTNCVDMHLSKNEPAIIVQAKGCSPDSWTTILSSTLDAKGWTKKEILSALESLAIRSDSIRVRSNKELTERSNAIICIDGLDEYVGDISLWYQRMRECETFKEKYPRVKFFFSARDYFMDYDELPDWHNNDDSITFIKGNDISVSDVAEQYFEAYNIELPFYTIIHKIDTLFALRLFCEEYKNQRLTDKDVILTLEQDLLNKKIERLNKEFLEKTEKSNLKNIRFPISEALLVISDYFYSQVEIDHKDIYDLICKETDINNYLPSQIDPLILFLSNSGLLIRSERTNKETTPHRRIIVYNISYQSIIESIISENILTDLLKGKLDKIPEILHNGMIQPFDKFYDPLSIEAQYPPNKRIIQNIITTVFIETGKLIGEDGYLAEGFSDEDILDFQMHILTYSPKEKGLIYKPKIDQMFFGGYKSQSYVLKKLILPSSRLSRKGYGCFDAEYLHNILINQTSAFERDKLWSGLDNWETKDFSLEEQMFYSYTNNNRVFDELGFGLISSLSEYDLHNQEPLIYAWGLSTINQKIRDNLRIKLTEWGIEQPEEFKLLLNKLFFCNDPQIQEDLASVTLGIASRLKKVEGIRILAEWALNNIFNHKDIFRNVIIRHGFRAIVEKAFLFNLVSKEDVEKTRPCKIDINDLDILPIESEYMNNQKRETYPILHDLAWYVIGKAYQGFLETDSKYTQIFFSKYEESYGSRFNKLNWTMAVALHYIKNRLELTRSRGNGTTEATHGAKSQIFTYEEKYVWLAVHYIKGYLADYLQFISDDWHDTVTPLKDYTQIATVPNPAESVKDLEQWYEKRMSSTKWIIKEELTKEIDDNNDLYLNMSEWIDDKPAIDFSKWIEVDSEDCTLVGENKWITLQNITAIQDSQEYCYARLDIVASLINKKNLHQLIDKLKHPKGNNLNLCDFLYTEPDVGLYCNPYDLVWMPWLEERTDKVATKEFYRGSNIDLYLTLTKMTQHTVEGEKYHIIPSKKVRDLLGIVDVIENEFRDRNENNVASIYNVGGGIYKDRQSLILVDKKLLTNNLEKEGLTIVWFATLLREQNRLNEDLDKNRFRMRNRKYFIWLDNGKLKNIELDNQEDNL